ncbi:unnamed protein product, partial [Mesorhabditis belari]|uniref:G-protein coupled receptors family 1 profile domain-containing protein n=1 Tax=Mesorhabditis belari TaxID=2138241 RepID=A0AAF3F3W8_9BILA
MDYDCRGNFSEVCQHSIEVNGADGIAGETAQYPIGFWIEITLYFVAFFVGGPLNVMSIFKLLRARRTLKHPSALLLLRLHLNIADLITLFIYIPKQIIWLITFAWYGGDLLCRLFSFISTFCFYLHSFVIACIAIDRLFGAWHINSVSASRKAFTRVSQLLIAAWVMATILALPQTLIFKLYELDDPSEAVPSKQCATFWMKAKYDSNQIFEHPNVSVAEKNRVDQQLTEVIAYEKWYTIAHLTFSFVLPTMLIIFSYTTLLFILKGIIKETGTVNGHSQMTSLLVLTRKHYTSEDDHSKVTGTTFVMHDAQSIRRNSNTPPGHLERAVSPQSALHTERSERQYDQSSRRVSSPFIVADDHSLMLNHKCDGGEISQNSEDFLRPPKKAKKPQRVPVSPFAIGKITKARKVRWLKRV